MITQEEFDSLEVGDVLITDVGEGEIVAIDPSAVWSIKVLLTPGYIDWVARIEIDSIVSKANPMSQPGFLISTSFGEGIAESLLRTQTPKCNCGGSIAKVPHSDWCWLEIGVP